MKKSTTTTKIIDSAVDGGPDDLDGAGQPGPGIRRVSIDLPAHMLERLDEESTLRGITRQSLIKVWLFERLEATSRSTRPTIVETQKLLELAVRDPRQAIRQAWEALARTILRITKVQGENLNPFSPGINESIKRLDSSIIANDLVLQVKELQTTANMAINQSEWAFNPSVDKAQKFVLIAAATRSDLGEMVA